MSTAFPAFGPPGQQWTYSDSNDTYDLTTQQSAKIFRFKPTISEGVTVPNSLGAGNAEVIIDPEATALVIVDMQNFFLDPTCMEHPKGLAAVQPTIKTIKKCREAGIQVIWLNWGLTDTDMESMPASVQRGFFHHEYSVVPPDGKPSRGGLGVDLGPDKGRTLFAHTWNADIYPELKTCVESTDIHCAKNRMSGLWSPEQPLYKTLKGEKKTTVLFAGVNTDQCVLGTLVDGYNNGWACVMIEDACGTTTAGAREVTLSNVSAYYGFVTDSVNFSAGVLESK